MESNTKCNNTRVKIFGDHSDISGRINKWISEQENIKIIDIKYSTCCSEDARAVYNHALIIYEELG